MTDIADHIEPYVPRTPAECGAYRATLRNALRNFVNSNQDHLIEVPPELYSGNSTTYVADDELTEAIEALGIKELLDFAKRAQITPV
jgi:hypothetical protein